MDKIKALGKILLALSITVFCLGFLPEGPVPHIVACISSCYLVHFVSHFWSLVKGKDHHHDGC